MWDAPDTPENAAVFGYSGKAVRHFGVAPGGMLPY